MNTAFTGLRHSVLWHSGLWHSGRTEHSVVCVCVCVHVHVCVCPYLVANKRFAPLDELHSQLVQLLEVI